MKAFTLDNLSEGPQEYTRSEFTTYFDEKGHDAQRPTVRTMSVEDETRKAFEDAFAQGEKAGHEMGMKKVDSVMKRLNGYISELSFFKEELLERSRKLSTDLALAFAEAIILRECEEKRETVLRMAKKALELCEERGEILIRMRKEDVEQISPDEVSHLKIIKDDTLKEPGFIIETNFGDIDGRISVQIEELKKEFIHGHLD
jgi:flagellar biosynthesis/type III secretory pathway protein FliH